MKTKLLSVLLLLIFTPCTLFAARPSINSLQTQVNQLGSEVNQIDERVSSLEALHTEPAPAAPIGQVEFLELSPPGPIDLVSVSLDITQEQGGQNQFSIVLSIPHSVLISELGKLAASGESLSDVSVSFNEGGVFTFESASIAEMNYSPANNPRIVMLRFNYFAINFDSTGGGCPSGRYVDLTDSIRIPDVDETPVTVFNFSVSNEGSGQIGGGGGPSKFDAGLMANLGELTACVIEQALTGTVTPSLRMDRYLDAILVKHPALSVELTNAIVKTLSVRTTSNGTLDTTISYSFEQIIWTTRDALDNVITHGWDLLTNQEL